VRAAGLKGARGSGEVLEKRWALAVFAAVFALLFAGAAIEGGFGAPKVPDGALVSVQGVPERLGTISEAEFQQEMKQQAAFSGLPGAPKPGTEDYETLRESALGELITSVWLQGEAEELGIELTNHRLVAELRKSGQAASLREAHFTRATMLERVMSELLVQLIQAELEEQVPRASWGEIRRFYEEEKATEFTTDERRDLRYVVAETNAEAAASREALEADRSPRGWLRVADRYSVDPANRYSGGVKNGVREETLLPALKEPIFGADVGVLMGPIEVDEKYFVVEVVRSHPSETEPLAEVRKRISAILLQREQQQAFTDFDSRFRSKWQSRTFCAEEAVVETCANRVDGHPPGAPAACYESDPKEPAAACPAPVVQPQPALPGSISEFNPDGERLSQAPLSDSGDSEGAEREPLESMLEDPAAAG
jgi:parvulin-like peptidyl-prolyl isomerase